MRPLISPSAMRLVARGSELTKSDGAGNSASRGHGRREGPDCRRHRAIQGGARQWLSQCVAQRILDPLSRQARLFRRDLGTAHSDVREGRRRLQDDAERQLIKSILIKSTGRVRRLIRPGAVTGSRAGRVRAPPARRGRHGSGDTLVLLTGEEAWDCIEGCPCSRRWSRSSRPR